jgi:uncharacterized protein (DUF1778 family)
MGGQLGPESSETRRLRAVVSVRFSEDEERKLRELATESGESLSTFIRSAALQAADLKSDSTVIPPKEETTTRNWNVQTSEVPLPGATSTHSS